MKRSDEERRRKRERGEEEREKRGEERKISPLLQLRTHACRRARGRGDVGRETVEIGGEKKEKRRERERENE